MLTIMIIAADMVLNVTMEMPTEAAVTVLTMALVSAAVRAAALRDRRNCA